MQKKRVCSTHNLGFNQFYGINRQVLELCSTCELKKYSKVEASQEKEIQRLIVELNQNECLAEQWVLEQQKLNEEQYLFISKIGEYLKKLPANISKLEQLKSSKLINQKEYQQCKEDIYKDQEICFSAMSHQMKKVCDSVEKRNAKRVKLLSLEEQKWAFRRVYQR